MGLGLIIQRRSHIPQGGGRNQSEWPAGINRNRWPEWIGISGRNGPEYAHRELKAAVYSLLGEKKWESLIDIKSPRNPKEISSGSGPNCPERNLS